MSMNAGRLFRLIVILTLVSLAYFYFIAGDKTAMNEPPQQVEVVEKNAAVEPTAAADGDQLDLGSSANTAALVEDNPVADETQNLPSPVAESAVEDGVGEGTFEAFSDLQSSNVHSLINDIRNRLANPSSENRSKLFQTKQNLLDIVMADGNALSELIGAFRSNLYDASMTQELLTVLSEVKDPEVEQLAVELTQSGIRAELITGLDLLGNLAIPNEVTLTKVTQIIDQNQYDPQVLLSALHALHPVVLPSQSSSQILNALSAMTKHENESVRSASLFAIGRWAKDAEQLGPVVEALDSTVIDDRISAAMVIENSSLVSQELKTKLIEIISDEDELWEIRIMAANSIKRFELNASEYDIYKQFQDKLTLDVSG